MKLRDIVLAILALSIGASLLVMWLAPGDIRQAPDITVTSVEGRQLALRGLHGHPVLVNFWSTTCPGCVKEIPRLVELHEAYAPRGLEVIGIAMAYDPPSHVIAFGKARAIPYPLALDIDSRAAAAFGNVQVTPSSFLIAPDGRVVYRQTGELDMDKVRRLVSDMLDDNNSGNG